MNLSQIFEDIVLNDSIISNHPFFDIELTFNNEKYPINLTKKNEYSLSNFNSFNNDSDSNLDFTELLQKIQQITGRVLSSSGVESILTQLKEMSTNLMSNYMSEQDKSTCRQTHLSCLS